MSVRAVHQLRSWEQTIYCFSVVHSQHTIHRGCFWLHKAMQVADEWVTVLRCVMHALLCLQDSNTSVGAGVWICSSSALSHTWKYENEFWFSGVHAGIHTVPEDCQLAAAVCRQASQRLPSKLYWIWNDNWASGNSHAALSTYVSIHFLDKLMYCSTSRSKGQVCKNTSTE